MTEQDSRLSTALSHLADLLERIGHPRATEVRALLQTPPEQLMQQLDSNAWWAGAGSLAAETMMGNPGLSEVLWQAEIREFRQLMIEIGERLREQKSREQGTVNPGLAFWLLAFNQWNASEV